MSSDIAPGWQKRAVELRELVRTCEHRGEHLVNPSGQLFCAQCGRHLMSGDIRNLLVDWISNPLKTAAQPAGMIDSEVLALLDDFEQAVRHESKDGT